MLLSLILALIPSILWLSFFLREDVHPEPNRLVLRAFFAGMLITIPTIAIEAILHCVLRGCPSGIPGQLPPFASSPFLLLPETWRDMLYLFLGIAFVEEFMKYLAVRTAVFRNKNFDEPIDALLYLVIAGLGFAAVENALTVTNSAVQEAGFFRQGGILVVLGARSLSATLLHALASGVVGYALARSYFSWHPKHFLFVPGLVIAMGIHGAYNGLVGGTFTEGNMGWALMHVAFLLVATGAVLLMLIKDLRERSIKHRWRNTGETVQEIS